MNGRAEVNRLKSRLDSTFFKITSASDDIELQAHFARYLCVLVSGFLENAIVALVLNFAQVRSSADVAGFIERQLAHWTNPNAEKICALLGSFNTDYRKALESYLVDERKETVNSLVALRHKIAHGEFVGTSLSQIRAYYRTTTDVVEFVASLLKQ